MGTATPMMGRRGVIVAPLDDEIRRRQIVRACRRWATTRLARTTPELLASLAAAPDSVVLFALPAHEDPRLERAVRQVRRHAAAGAVWACYRPAPGVGRVLASVARSGCVVFLPEDALPLAGSSLLPGDGGPAGGGARGHRPS